jgi:hypothetical protein
MQLQRKLGSRRQWITLLAAALLLPGYFAAVARSGEEAGAGTANAGEAKQKTASPEYNARGELKLPADYRTWVFVGSNMGIEYGDDANQPAKKQEPAKQPDGGKVKVGNFHNVYINPEAYAEYVKSGKFPEKTVLVLDVYKAEPGTGIVTEGLFPGRQTGIAIAVKNSARPDGEKTNWAYYDFAPGKTTAKAFADKACYDCHLHHADDDNVWVQFYPTLLRLKEKK